MKYYTLIYYSISAFVLALATFLLIIKPQRDARKKLRMLEKNLMPGAWLKTHDGLSGTILHIHEHSVLIQSDSGQIVEILKQSIEDIRTT